MDAVEIDTSEETQNDDEIGTTVPGVCRVCLMGNLMMRDLFLENEVVSLSTKAMSFASVKMLPGDGLPAQVCCDCADKLDSAYEFKLQVEQADNVLRQRYDLPNIKPEFFLNEVAVHLDVGPGNPVHRLHVNDHYEAAVDSLTDDEVVDEKSTLLKDHLALLQVQKLAEQERAERERAAAEEMKRSAEIVEQTAVAEMLEATADHNRYLHQNVENGDEMTDCEVYRQSVKDEAMQEMEGMAIDEHNYIMHQGYALARTQEELDSQETVETAPEPTEYLSLMDEPMDIKNETVHTETFIKPEQHPEPELPPKTEKIVDSPSETRRSKRQMIKRVRNSAEENYFENLNLSSRLKKTNEKSEKFFFLCYLCDKQFISKAILKEHMHSHEEVRRTLSLKKTEKLDKRQNSTKIVSSKASTSTSTPTSSGKKPNKCPYCGKEYLYVISFAKHLKQHEKNKDSLKETSSSMSFEDSIRDEDDESSDFAGYDEATTSETNNRVVKRENEDDESSESNPETTKRRRSNRSKISYSCDDCQNLFSTKKELAEHSVVHNTSLKCNTCDMEFDDLEKLRRHRSEHVVEGVLTDQDLENNVYEREFDAVAPDDVQSTNYDNQNDQRINYEATDDNQTVSQMETSNQHDWDLEDEHEVYDNSDCKDNNDENDENLTENKNLKCPHCTVIFSYKKSLERHMEIHEDMNYVCKICERKFEKRDQLQRHTEQHGKTKYFKCTDCNKTFGNELTLRNHLIATNHKTTLHGEVYDPNKRMKRVAAKAAQRIIDKIKTEDDSEEDADVNDETEAGNSKTNSRWTRNDEKVHSTAAARKVQRRNRRRCDFECETCGRKCSSKQSLTKHMEDYHVKDEKSEIVGIKIEKTKKFSSHENNDVSSFQTQKKIFSNDNRTIVKVEDDDDNSDFESGLDWPMDNHECTTCKKKYSTKKSLLRHQLLHEEPNFECDICNVKFYRKDKLKSHYDKCSEKNPDQVRKCNICGDTFENNEILKEHRAKHVDEGILTEDDLRELEPDERREGGKIVRKRRTDIVGLECTECNKQYTSRKGLLRHIQVHEGKKYLCDICPKKFYRREHLKIHVAKHNMIKPYKCSRCSKRFIKEEQLANHLSKHDRNFKKTKETDSSKRFLCEICSKSFTQSTTLIAHLRAHNGIKPYVCDVCARPFTTNAYLKMHMRTHTQERPYSCQYCSRAFARADTLANHLTSHTGEAKYHCKYCPKNFRRLKSLKEHVFIHTGQRPYSCPTCDRRFNNNGSRYAHSKRCKQNLAQNQSRSQTLQPNVVHTAPQHIRIHQITADNGVQVVKSQNIKTITITRPNDQQVTEHQVMEHQEILMPLILPLTVTLTDVDDEVILPEGTKIFTTA